MSAVSSSEKPCSACMSMFSEIAGVERHQSKREKGQWRRNIDKNEICDI